MSAKSKPHLFVWREYVFESTLSPTVRHVIHVLSFHGDENGNSCYPSYSTLARETGYNRSTVLRSIQIAESEGWITRTARVAFDGSLAKGGRGQTVSTVAYRLTVPTTGGTAPPVPDETVGTAPPVSKGSPKGSTAETGGTEAQTGGAGVETGGTEAQTGGTAHPNLSMISTGNSPANSPSFGEHAFACSQSDYELDDDYIAEGEVVVDERSYPRHQPGVPFGAAPLRRVGRTRRERCPSCENGMVFTGDNEATRCGTCGGKGEIVVKEPA